MECGPKVPKNVRIAGSVRKRAKMCKESGIEFAEVGLEYFCLDYVIKNGVSITECNTMCHSHIMSKPKKQKRNITGLQNLGSLVG